MMTFAYATKAQFVAHSAEVADHVAAFGYAVVRPWDHSAAALRQVAERFGRVQSHIRADANGLVGIATDAVVNHDWEQFRSEYHGVSAEEFLPHTDGSYLHGIVYANGAYEQLLPPRMLLLQCVQAAASGGQNVLIDGQAVRRDLARERPGDLALLSRKGCVTYCRDDQIALDCAVFQALDDGTVMLRFRYDTTAYVADWAMEAFATLQNRYFADSKYFIRRSLAADEILVIDNHRMLHGRDAFADAGAGQKRQMRRVWLAHEGMPLLLNAVGQHVDRRALRRFGSYFIHPAATARDERSLACTGIRCAA
jgi:alpha-ketoglutarate-dependent taurine dioxygenase